MVAILGESYEVGIGKWIYSKDLITNEVGSHGQNLPMPGGFA